MRIACGLALAIGLSVAAAASSQQQDPAGAANTAAQAPTPSEAPPEKPAAGTGDAPDKSAPQSDTNSNSDSPSKAEPASPKSTQVPRSGSSKRHKRITPSEDGLRKVVVRRGGTTEPAAQIAPGMTPAEAARQRQNVERLLGATDDQLQLLATRTLDAQRQETVGQIRNYLEQTRSALKEGDLRRATTLAEKAHLLSDDLVKR